MISDRIVVVDDNPKVVKSIKVAFPEYEIIDFSDGKSALNYLLKPNDVKLVLLDIMMPEVDGLSVLNEIKKFNKDLAVIIMTGFATKDFAIQALRYHADDFIEKPFDAEALREKIRLILKGKLGQQTAAEGQEAMLEGIRRFIKRNYSNVSLDSLAEHLFLTPKYVSRMFKETSGLSFREFLIEVKLEIAKKMLIETTQSIDEISYQLGYQNTESFMRIFKKKMKLTPTEYRKAYPSK